MQKEMCLKRYYLDKMPEECIFCGKKENIEIHHIDKNRKNNNRKNLLKLCVRCHRLLHSRIYKILWPEKKKKEII